MVPSATTQGAHPPIFSAIVCTCLTRYLLPVLNGIFCQTVVAMLSSGPNESSPVRWVYPNLTVLCTEGAGV